jgi:hypothetical protein
MPRPPRRQRRETAEALRGVGGLSPHPARGPITALRVLGQGYEIPVDAARAERLARMGVDHVRLGGDTFTSQGMTLLALDEPTRQLVLPLTAYCGVGAHDDVDSALVAVLWKRPIILHGSRSEDALELARTIHEHSIRKGFPFTQVNTVPKSDAAIEALCTEAGCGTIFLDLTKPFKLPWTFIRHLFSDYFHLWTIMVAPVAENVRRCFGPCMDFVPICKLGFSRTVWHRSMRDVTFTKH